MVISSDTYYFGETRAYLKLYNSCLTGKFCLLSEQKEIQSSCKTVLQWGGGKMSSYLKPLAHLEVRYLSDNA